MSASSASCRILYVEDNPAEAHLLDSTLKSACVPFELTVLEDGEQALMFIEAKPFRPDVIVLDLNMPGIDGLTVLATLKADPTLKSIPVLVFVSPNTPNWKRARELKAELCLAKPFDLAGYDHVGDSIRQLSQGLFVKTIAAGS